MPDTNVLASGFVALAQPASVPGAILRSWQARAFELLVSEPVVTELVRTFEKAYFRDRFTVRQRERAIFLLRNRATVVTLTETVSGVATHPEDDLILATAISGQADYLVTGDRQLRKLDAFRGVTILTPREFLDLLVARGLVGDS